MSLSIPRYTSTYHSSCRLLAGSTTLAKCGASQVCLETIEIPIAILSTCACYKFKARHSLACSCPSVCPGCQFQTVLRVYIPDEIHALGLPSSKNTRGMNTTFSYSAKVFDSPFGEICTTPSRTVTSTCRVFS